MQSNLEEKKEFTFPEVSEEFPNADSTDVLVCLLNGDYDIDFVREHLRKLK